MLKTDKGHIVNVASLAGMNGINRLVDYCSSKFAAVGFDESLRTELQANHINNNCLSVNFDLLTFSL